MINLSDNRDMTTSDTNLLAIYLLRHLMIGYSLNLSTEWHQIETLIKEEKYSDFFRYSIASELMRNELLE